MLISFSLSRYLYYVTTYAVEGFEAEKATA
jgi:hypothetical protein